MTMAEAKWMGANQMEPTYLAGSIHLYNWWGHHKIISLAILRSLWQTYGKLDREKAPNLCLICLILKNIKIQMDLE